MNRTVNKKAIWITLAIIAGIVISYLVGVIEANHSWLVFEGNSFGNILMSGLFSVACLIFVLSVVVLIICGIYLFFNWMFPKKGGAK